MRYKNPEVGLAAEIDDLVATVPKTSTLSSMRGRWINSVRRSIGMPSHALAKRLGISQSALSQIEKREATGGITIERMNSVADSLNCDFVYALVPRVPLAEKAQALESAQTEARRRHRVVPRQS